MEHNVELEEYAEAMNWLAENVGKNLGELSHCDDEIIIEMLRKRLDIIFFKEIDYLYDEMDGTGDLKRWLLARN